jgi:hypothetical protein
MDCRKEAGKFINTSAGKIQATNLLLKGGSHRLGPDDSLYLLDSNYCLRKFKLG